MRKLFYVRLGFRQQTEKLEFGELTTHAVILSERSESKDLRTCFVLCSGKMRRSFDFALRASLRMTTSVQIPIYQAAAQNR